MTVASLQCSSCSVRVHDLDAHAVGDRVDRIPCLELELSDGVSGRSCKECGAPLDGLRVLPSVSGREVSVGTVLRRFDPRLEAGRFFGAAVGRLGRRRAPADRAGADVCLGLGSSPLGQAGAGGHEITGTKRPFVACGRMGDESMNRQWCKDCI